MIHEAAIASPTSSVVEETLTGSGDSSSVRKNSEADFTIAPSEAKEEGSDERIWVEFEDGDPTNPFNFSKAKKWAILIMLLTFTAISSANTSTYAVGYPSMMRDLNCSREQAAAGLGLYAFGFGITPLVTASFSEEFGRLPMYISTAFLFAIFSLPIALAKNIQTVLIFRFLQGGAGSSGATMVGGSIADVWRTHERGTPMSLFASTATFMAGAGPAIAGWIELNTKLEWRWIQWIHLITSGVYVIVIIFFMPETRGSVILTRRARRLRKETGDQRYRARIEDVRPSLREMIYVSCTRPLTLLLTEPVVASFSLWIGFAWGVLYAIIQSIGLVFGELYHFNSGQVGLTFLAICVGVIFGTLTNFYQEKLYKENVARIGAEARLYTALGAGILLPVGCFLYAWTSYSSIHWIVPVIGVTILFWGIFIAYLAVFNYLADSYLIYASSALAGQSLIRNLMGTVFPLFTNQMYNRLGFHWAGSLFGFIAAVLAFVPYILFFYGPSIRAKSRFAKTLAAQTSSLEK